VNGDVNISGVIDAVGSRENGTFSLVESTLSHTSAHNSILHIQNASDDPVSEANIQFAAGSPAHGRATISATHDVSAGLYNGNLNLEVRYGTTNYRKAITMRSSGKVGIGNEDPSEKLSVSGMVESTTGGFKFPDGTIQTTASTGSTTYYIGESYGGGIIFWLDASGQHGLIAATTDQSTGIQWYNGTYRYTGTTSDGLYAGAMNTALIVATQIADNQTGNFAAKVCADYSVIVGGVTYGDWYLPSKYELNLLYLQKTAVGDFADNYYWSSTENLNLLARIQNFLDGTQTNASKYFTFYVRAIRAF
nr:DUF1566 domain-containing protein [Candidatus Cloacimonadota bacterium]